MARPTVEAKFHFDRAKHFANEAGGHYTIHKGREPVTETELGDRTMTRALVELADGLGHLSDGIRATYILLDELKGLLQQKRQ
jgi:hypothetical protein